MGRTWTAGWPRESRNLSRTVESCRSGPSTMGRSSAPARDSDSCAMTAARSPTSNSMRVSDGSRVQQRPGRPNPLVRPGSVAGNAALVLLLRDPVVRRCGQTADSSFERFAVPLRGPSQEYDPAGGTVEPHRHRVYRPTHPGQFNGEPIVDVDQRTIEELGQKPLEAPSVCKTMAER